MSEEDLVGQTLRLTFDDIAPKGDAVATTGAPKPVFAGRVIPGEEVLVRVRRMRRNWIAVDIESIVTPSPHRVEPRCPLFDTCSGCQLQHVDYAHQLELKRRMVSVQLERFGGFVDAPVLPVIGAEDPWYYRNHARFTVKDRRLGFIRRYKRQWFEVPHCMIMEPEINRILETLQGRIDTTQCNVRVGANAGSLMVQPRLKGDDIPVESGQTHVDEELLGRPFRVSAASFFQVNRPQAERMVEVLRDRVGTGDLVVADAYAGVGTFAVLLADGVTRVLAIEESAQAIADARINVAGIANIELLHGKAEEVLPALEQRIDVVILDPPRSGCLPAALEAVCRLHPRRVVYVSCDPASLGRDLRSMCGESGPFRLRDVQPIDMFPHTHHVETVTTLEG
jgi:23S rRNA (uracil1939-C5)-methyltransferase